jgi:hypothetical protein
MARDDLTPQEIHEIRQNQDQIMAALKMIKMTFERVGIQLAYDVHMESGHSKSRVPHMASADCHCGEGKGPGSYPR